MVFILIPVFSIILSNDIFHSFVYYLLDLFLPFAYFFILVKSLKKLEDVKTFIYALIISVFIYEFFALYFMYQKGTAKDITTGLYASGINTGFRPVLIPLIIPFQVALNRLLKGWKRIFVGLMLLIFITYLVLSNYRMGIVVILIGFIVFSYYYRITIAKKIYFLIAGLLGLVIFVLYSQELYEKLLFFRFIETFQLLSRGEPLATISSERTSIWQSALEMIRDFPLFGIGPDMWSQYIPQYSRTNYFHWDMSGNIIRYYEYDPHNLYMLVWLNYGILSFICYVIILYMAIKRGIWNIKESSSNLTRTLSIASLISLIIWVVSSLATVRFYDHGDLLYAIIFWSIIGVILKLNEYNPTLKVQIAER